MDMDELPVNTVICGDCLAVLKEMPDCSVDAIVTDPPAGIGFMGVGWDTYGEGKGQARTDAVWDCIGSKEHPRTAQSQQRIIAKQGRAFRAFMTEVFTEALRVIRPGGHAFVWALPRTSHWTATALEDAGWEIREVVVHLFGSGFPKSHNISAAIDKHFKAEREVVGVSPYHSDGRKTAIWGNEEKRREDTKPHQPHQRRHAMPDMGRHLNLLTSTGFYAGNRSASPPSRRMC